jgi:hypothetical protein
MRSAFTRITDGTVDKPTASCGLSVRTCDGAGSVAGADEALCAQLPIDIKAAATPINRTSANGRLHPARRKLEINIENKKRKMGTRAIDSRGW